MSLETILGLKYLDSLMRIRDGKIRIRDKHPGSATLVSSEPSGPKFYMGEQVMTTIRVNFKSF